MQADAKVLLGPTRVRVDAERAAEFARETNNVGNSNVAPMAYPAVWLSAPQVHAAIAGACARAASFPLHESQSFAYDQSVRFDADYVLDISISREESPPRLRIEASLTTVDGAPVGRFESLLRLVPRGGIPS